jgi:hypothetical protein
MAIMTIHAPCAAHKIKVSADGIYIIIIFKKVDTLQYIGLFNVAGAQDPVPAPFLVERAV